MNGWLNVEVVEAADMCRFVNGSFGDSSTFACVMLLPPADTPWPQQTPSALRGKGGSSFLQLTASASGAICMDLRRIQAILDARPVVSNLFLVALGVPLALLAFLVPTLVTQATLKQVCLPCPWGTHSTFTDVPKASRPARAYPCPSPTRRRHD